MPRYDEFIPTGVANMGGTGTQLVAPARIRGRVQLWSREASINLVARHAELPQVTQERAGGWVTVDRPGLVSITTWTGGKPLRLKLTLMFDGWTEIPRRRVGDDLDVLRFLGYRNDEIKRPPTVRIIGAVPYANGGVLPSHAKTPPDWVIEELSIEEKLHLPSGACAQAIANVTLMEYFPADTTVARAKGKKADTYKWKRGNTLASVARDELGDPRRSQWIRDANPKVKSWSKVQVGTKIKIPRVVA